MNRKEKDGWWLDELWGMGRTPTYREPDRRRDTEAFSLDGQFLDVLREQARSSVVPETEESQDRSVRS
ncbi:hypothetical protein [Exiguobacterium sp. 8A]|uniref:hypothetical protein n=1 Tax=Exiguobacterium sp. 8A TaxID=2653139 RepID=UPI00135BFC0F|nr:hypothetical protein [Exiguobacterium sp. 8A]